MAVICSDYARSKKFYTEVLGLEIVAENWRAERNSYKLDLQTPGGPRIELFSFPNPPKRPTRPEAAGLRHLAFRVGNLEDAIYSLMAHGVECEPIRRDPITGGRFTFFPDPDGLPLELYEELK